MRPFCHSARPAPARAATISTRRYRVLTPRRRPTQTRRTSNADVRVPLRQVWRRARGVPDLRGDAAHQAQGLRREARQGPVAGRHRAQGLRLLQDRQPQLLASGPRLPGLQRSSDSRSSESGSSASRRAPSRARRARARSSGDSKSSGSSSGSGDKKLGLGQLGLGQLVVGLEEARGQERLSRRVGPAADVGVFGGSGFYSFLDGADEVEIDTPFGAPSDPITIGAVGDTAGGVHPASRPRPSAHAGGGAGPRQPLGAAHARRAHGDRAVRGRLAEVRPCTPATSSCSTSSSTARGDGPTRSTTPGSRHHVSFADPYCPVVAAAAVDAGRRVGVTVHERGTVVVVQGPRFSTRAESAWYRAQGWDVVNMTQYPEAYLARELGMHYAGIALDHRLRHRRRARSRRRGRSPRITCSRSSRRTCTACARSCST